MCLVVVRTLISSRSRVPGGGDTLETETHNFETEQNKFDSVWRNSFLRIAPICFKIWICQSRNLHVEKMIKENFDLSPRGIREMLGLNKPIYQKTSAYGHFGREPELDGSFSWEKTDKSSVFIK